MKSSLIVDNCIKIPPHTPGVDSLLITNIWRSTLNVYLILHQLLGILPAEKLSKAGIYTKKLSKAGLYTIDIANKLMAK